MDAAMFPGALLAVLLGAPPPEAGLNARAEELVARLGDPSFRRREQAAHELLEIGYPARDAVLAGQKSKDSEINDRCLKLYPVIWRTDLGKRVQKLLDDPDGAVPADLPGATRWVKLVGDGKDSRQLYAEMVKAHPEPLLEVELHPERLPEAYVGLAKEVSARLVGRPSTVQANGPRAIRESEMLLFLFLGAAGGPRPDTAQGAICSSVSRFLNSPALQKRLGEETADAPFRRLYAAWLENERYTLIVRRGIDLAAEHRVRECIAAVVTIAKDSGTVATVRATAVIGLGRLGTRDDIKELGPLMKDEAEVWQTVINKQRATVQIRDVALGAAIHLAGRNPNDFGFEHRLPAGATLSASYLLYVFATDEKRAAAHEKWAKWAADNLKK
jgi:hypothetical protein